MKNNYLDLNKNMSVLDVGCGHGRHLNLFYNLGFRNLTGVDIVKRSYLNKKYKYIKFDIREDFSNESLLQKEYDIVLCNFVLMFISPNQQIKVIDKLLKTTNKYLLIETREIGGKYSYSCYIQNFYYYIKTKREFEIIYYNKNKERLTVKRKWQQVDM
jgi:SAM-dependent methyltransferase